VSITRNHAVGINEAFGDTVNWDLIPDIAIDRIDVLRSEASIAHGPAPAAEKFAQLNFLGSIRYRDQLLLPPCAIHEQPTLIGDLSIEDLQSEMALEGFKVSIRVQQRMIVYDAEGRNQHIDSLSDRDALNSQLPLVLGGEEGHVSTDQVRAGQAIQEGAGAPIIGIARESLQELGGDERVLAGRTARTSPAARDSATEGPVSPVGPGTALPTRVAPASFWTPPAIRRQRT
jgi:hypothetical protein